MILGQIDAWLTQALAAIPHPVRRGLLVLAALWLLYCAMKGHTIGPLKMFA